MLVNFENVELLRETVSLNVKVQGATMLKSGPVYSTAYRCHHNHLHLHHHHHHHLEQQQQRRRRLSPIRYYILLLFFFLRSTISLSSPPSPRSL